MRDPLSLVLTRIFFKFLSQLHTQKKKRKRKKKTPGEFVFRDGASISKLFVSQRERIEQNAELLEISFMTAHQF